MKYVSSMLVVASSLLFVTTAYAQKKATYTKVKPTEIKRIAKKAEVRDVVEDVGDSLGSPTAGGIVHAFRGPVGPFKKGYVHVSAVGNGFSFWVLGNVEGSWQAWSAVADEMADIEAVFFEDIQGDGLVEVFVLHSTTRGGIHGAWTHYTVEGLEWNPKTSRFERRPEWFEELNARTDSKAHTTGPATAKAVREHLAKQSPTRKVAPVTKKVAPVKITARGGLDLGGVRSVFRKHRYEINTCYKKGLESNANLKGTINLEITVSKSGSVKATKVTSSDLDDRVVEDCVVKKVNRWIFREPEGDNATITYPLVFK